MLILLGPADADRGDCPRKKPPGFLDDRSLKEGDNVSVSRVQQIAYVSYFTTKVDTERTTMVMIDGAFQH
jgi:hypothetical protein